MGASMAGKLWINLVDRSYSFNNSISALNARIISALLTPSISGALVTTVSAKIIRPSLALMACFSSAAVKVLTSLAVQDNKRL